MKRFILLLLLILVIFPVQTMAFEPRIECGDEIREHFDYDESKMDCFFYDEKEDNSTLEPFAVDSCPGRGNHTMMSRGWGSLIRVDSNGKKTTVFKGGACWQCKYCREVLVTQNDPLRIRKVGYYAMRNPGYVISASGMIMEAPSTAIKYTSGSKVPYCNLFYN